MSDATGGWGEDILGPDYMSLDLSVPRSDGTPRRATLVRHRPVGAAGLRERGGQGAPGRDPVPVGAPAPRPAVLYIHGWSDYFYNTGLAEFFTAHGWDFYALDLHNHGRSLVSHELGGYVDDLSDYDDEIVLAHSIIEKAAGVGGVDFPVLLMGHSTGGLIAALWAHKYPHKVGQLVLNSPWLELQGGAAIRYAATPLVRSMAGFRPLTRMRVPERTFYWRGISDDAYGDWRVDRKMRPPKAFPVRAGWMRAVLAGQRQVAGGLGLAMPVLVLLSSRSMLGPVWNGDMLRADVVLDVRALALRAVSLGSSVSVERIDGALHEVFLSGGDVRLDAYLRLERWLRGYGPDFPE